MVYTFVGSTTLASDMMMNMADIIGRDFPYILLNIMRSIGLV